MKKTILFLLPLTFINLSLLAEAPSSASHVAADVKKIENRIVTTTASKKNSAQKPIAAYNQKSIPKNSSAPRARAEEVKFNAEMLAKQHLQLEGNTKKIEAGNTKNQTINQERSRL